MVLPGAAVPRRRRRVDDDLYEVDPAICDARGSAVARRRTTQTRSTRFQRCVAKSNAEQHLPRTNRTARPVVHLIFSPVARFSISCFHHFVGRAAICGNAAAIFGDDDTIFGDTSAVSGGRRRRRRCGFRQTSHVMSR
eukprot:2296865-Rhodomonas_salina.1